MLLSMMIVTAIAGVFGSHETNAIKKQQEKSGHNIVFQLVTGDTTSHKQLMKQLNNIMTIAPESKIEVVCHGPGIDMVHAEKTIVREKIKALTEKGVKFVACEFSLKEKKIDKSSIITESGFVPAGIIEIVSKQEMGWSYIKAGI
ncbi:MAG: hypothetical protein Fur0041_12660 [Bacteroidia bacterium]